MIKNHREDANKWCAEIDDVEDCRRIVLLTVYLQEMLDFADPKFPRIKG